jgi:hypothetical protein
LTSGAAKLTARLLVSARWIPRGGAGLRFGDSGVDGRVARAPESLAERGARAAGADDAEVHRRGDGGRRESIPSSVVRGRSVRNPSAVLLDTGRVWRSGVGGWQEPAAVGIGEGVVELRHLRYFVAVAEELNAWGPPDRA